LTEIQNNFEACSKETWPKSYWQSA